MKELTDAEKLEIAVGLLGERELEEYAEKCYEEETESEDKG